MNPERCCTLDNFYKALADETRQSILVLLKDGEMSAGELTEHFTLSQPSISHHLAILRRVHLVYSSRAGQRIFYRLNPDCVAACCQEMLAGLRISNRE